MSCFLVLVIEISGITAIHPVHEFGYVLTGRSFDQDMRVIRHETVRVQEDLMGLLGFFEKRKVFLSVGIFQKDILLLVASHHDMITGEIDKRS